MERQALTRDRLNELIRQFDTAMLVTRTDADLLRARPMAIADIDDDGHVWFITGRGTGKVHEIGDRDVVSLTMQGSMVFVSLTAVARTIEDRARIRELWRESWRVWFPDGPQSADLVLIRAEPTQGEFWDNRGSKGLSFLWEAVRAYVSGDELDDTELDERQHGRVSLDQPSGADDGR